MSTISNDATLAQLWTAKLIIYTVSIGNNLKEWWYISERKREVCIKSLHKIVFLNYPLFAFHK